MGALETKAGLSQRFTAKILLFESTGQPLRDVQVALADSDDFGRMGVERFFDPTQLRFEVTPAHDNSAVQILSNRTTTEPNLNFVLEVAWRGGRMLKEHTVCDRGGERPALAVLKKLG